MSPVESGIPDSKNVKKVEEKGTRTENDWYKNEGTIKSETIDGLISEGVLWTF